MFLNKRMPAKKLLYYTALAARRELDALEMYNLRTIKKGYEGECLYDKFFDEIGHENIYIIRDVYLKIGGSVTQYDSIVITENRLVMNEIKNLSGDYRFDNNKWMKDSVELTDNVYAQLSRGKGKLLKLRNENQLNIEIEGKMIFLNDDFRLTSENDYIWDETVLLNQMRSYFRKFREEYVGNKANNIVRIIKNQIVEDPYFKESADIFHLHTVHQSSPTPNGSSNVDGFGHLLLIRTFFQCVLGISLNTVRTLQSVGNSQGNERFLSGTQRAFLKYRPVVSQKFFP